MILLQGEIVENKLFVLVGILLSYIVVIQK